MIAEENLLFEDGLRALLVQEGRERLVTLALACATFVLPLYEASASHDPCLRRALRRDPCDADLRRAKQAVEAAWRSEADAVYQAAEAVVEAAHLPALGGATAALNDSRFVYQVLSCVQGAEDTVECALTSGSAQERLDLLGRMEGHTSFAALLCAWLVEPEGVWRDRLAQRTLDTP